MLKLVSPPETLSMRRRSLTAGATVADTPSRKERTVRPRIVLLAGVLILALSIVGVGTASAASSMSSRHTTSMAAHSGKQTPHKMVSTKVHTMAKAAKPMMKKARFTG
jgi:hypothetical protein